MKNKKLLLILCLAFALLLAVAGVLYKTLGDTVESEQILYTEATPAPAGEESETESESSSIPAPDFTAYNAEGEAVKLSDFKGKPVILNFWASWCGYCVTEMPEFQAVYEKYGEDIQFIMLNCTDGSQETMDSANAFLADKDYSFPVFYDKDLEGTYAYSAYSLPQTYLIDAEGNALGVARGAITGEALERAIGDLFGMSK